MRAAKNFSAVLTFLLVLQGNIHAQTDTAAAQDAGSQPVSSPANADNSGSAASTDTTGSPDSAAAAPKAEIPKFELGFRLGYLYQGQTYPTSPDPSHPDVNGIRADVFLPSFGVQVLIPTSSYFGFQPFVAFDTDEYIWKASAGQAFPVDNETGSAAGPLALVLNLYIGVDFQFSLHLSPEFSFDFGPGICFLPRIPLNGIDGTTDTSAIGTYLNQNLRWLYPSVDLGLKYISPSGFAGNLQFRSWFPIWHIWDAVDTNFADYFILEVSFTVSILL